MARAEVLSQVKMVLDESVSSQASYLAFLDTVSKFHKYNHEQQASIALFAGSGFSAVADERIWNQVFHANLKQDAKAIEILDENAPNGVKTVYDVSDTDIPEERREKLLWRFDSERDSGVFRGIADEGASPVDSILQFCWRLEDDPVFAQSGLSGDDILLLSESVGYVLFKRLGYEDEADLLAQQTILEENVVNSNIRLDVISDLSREILNGIQDYVQRGKGRGEEYPLEDVMIRVHEIINSLHEQKAEDRQEVSAAEPEGNAVSSAFSAPDNATDNLSVAAGDPPLNIPVLADRRRFDVSPDGLDLVEFNSLPDRNIWAASRDLPDDYLTVSMQYMSNGRIEVNIYNSVTEDEDAFVAFNHDALTDSGRKVFFEMLPNASDADLSLLSSHLLTHAMIMERRFNAIFRDHQPVPPLDEEKEYADFMESYTKQQEKSASDVLGSAPLADGTDSSPAQDSTKDSSFAGDNIVEQGSLFDEPNTDNTASGTSGESNKEAESALSGSAVRADNIKEFNDSLDLFNYLDATIYFLSKNGDYVSAGDFKKQECRIRVFLYEGNKLGCMIENKDYVGQLFVEDMKEAFDKLQDLSSTYLPDADPEAVASSVIENYRALVDRKYLAYAHPGYGSVHEIHRLTKEDYASLGIDYNVLQEEDTAHVSAEGDTSPEFSKSSLRQALEKDPAANSKIDELNSVIQDLDSMRQEENTVEVSATEAEAATKDAAEQEGAATSPVSPAQDTATDESSVAGADDSSSHSAILDTREYHLSPKGRILKRGNANSLTVKLDLYDNGKASLSIEKTNRTAGFSNEVDSPQHAYDIALYDRNLFDDFNLSVLAASVKEQYQDMLRVNGIEIFEQQNSSAEASATSEAVASSEVASQDTATDVSSVAGEKRSLPVSEFSREVIDSRVYFISSDGKRSNKPKPSMLRIDVSLRDDGAAYIDIATHNRNSGAGILADDPNDAHEFALRTSLVQSFNAKVVADAILSDYQEMMREHDIPVPFVVDQRRFDVSPDGVDIMEYAYDPENDFWISSGPSPENHVRVVMRYMSNGRVDVGISDSVTERSSNFVDYENLFNSSRAIIYDVSPDSNAEMIANWVVQHASLMERAAKKASLQEESTVEVSATEAEAATKEAAEPDGAATSSVPPAQDTETDVSSVAADTKQYDPEMFRYGVSTEFNVSQNNHYVDAFGADSCHVIVGLSDDKKDIQVVITSFKNEASVIYGPSAPAGWRDVYQKTVDAFSAYLPNGDPDILASSFVQNYRALLRGETYELSHPAHNSENSIPSFDFQQASFDLDDLVSVPEETSIIEDSTKVTANPEEADSLAEASAVESNDLYSDDDRFISVKTYFELAGVQVIPSHRSNEFFAYAREHSDDEAFNRGKYVVINSPDLVSGKTSFTVVSNRSVPVSYNEDPDYVLDLLGVDMIAFHDAFEKFDGTNFKEVALPYNNYINSFSEDASVSVAETPATESLVSDNVSKEHSNEASQVSSDTPKYHGGKKGEAFQNNIKAIQLLKTLEKENRSPNGPEEEAALRGYSGFGNLSEVFDDNNESWKAERDLLKSVLTNEEFLAARSSVLSAFYTDPAIASAIYDGLFRMGFNDGNILEPSCGIGNFFLNMPSFMREKSHLFGVELDLITGRIARQLHRDADISIQGFESTSFPDGAFDLSITNVPFENYKIQGRSVHDYFLWRMAQQTRPGGLMVAITSRYSMDKKDSSTREDLARECELIKAIRLPNTAFLEAGTEATTDILIFRRREKALGYNDALPSWVNSVPFENDPNILVNPYFTQHPEDVIGTLEKKSTAYGFDLTCSPKENARETGDIANEVIKAMSSIRTEYVPLVKPLPVPEQLHDDNSAAYSFFVKGEEILFRGANNSDIKALADIDISEADKPQVMQLIRLRDLTREVIRSQQFTDNDDFLHSAQERLQSVYQDYVNSYGNLHTKKAKQIFHEDCSYPLLLSLENVDSKGNVISLGDIFTKRTIRPHIPPTHVDTSQEALIVSMTEQGKVDLDYMQQLTGKSVNEITDDLEYKELFWDEYSSSFQSADEYLSGDIRQKMEYLENSREFTLDHINRDIWDSLLSPTIAEDDREYEYKNETEEHILKANSSYLFTDEAIAYMNESADRDFCFAFLHAFNGRMFYRLPNRFSSDPSFCLEAGILYGNQVDSNDAVNLLTNIADAMQIEGFDGSLNDYTFLEFLQNGTEKEYPQKRAAVQYLRDISKDFNGTNGDALVARASEEWPRVWKGWQAKYADILEKEELLGLSASKKELERIDKNFAALKAVCPKDLNAEEISVRLGAPWIPSSDIEHFIHDVFGLWRDVEYSDVHHGQWKIESSRSRRGASDYTEKEKEFSTNEFNACALLEKILNLQMAVVKDTIYVDGQEKQVVNQEKTVLAQQKQEMIKEAFSKWIWQDEERKERLVKYYNRHLNNIRPREYDGSYLDFPGMNPEIQLRSHQKDAIAHTLFGGNTLLAHCVGAGKSFEMIASIMEAKRLGLSSKAMLVVPGHLTEQMGAEFMRLYPTANILVATKKDFEKAHRKEFCAKIATHNWDAVILGFTQFEKVAMSKEYMENFTKEEISRLEHEIATAAAADGKSLSVRQLERLKKRLEEKLHSLQDKKPKDDVINFEDLGVDRLYVDEAHNFKNLAVITKLQRLPGINTESAQKSMDFYQKVQYINNKSNCKGLVFATGTMISNSMTELYVMQQYLQPDRLYSEGLRHFDTWATTFGEIATVSELAPEGKGIRPRQRFSKFSNLPELMSMVKEFADIKTVDMLDLPTPNVEYHVESVPASPEQKAMVDALADRAVAIRNKSVDTSLPENNMLSVTNEGRKLALDQRMLNPNLPDNPGSKVNRCVDNVFRIWEDSKDSKGTQLVFSDLGTPDKTRFNVYDEIKEKLIAKGVPADEIAFIHDANNEKQKEELFAKVRAGKVRVLLGSTGKLGTGTNVQDRLVASHDLDVPWKPSDLEQRKGRIARQGNMNEKVDVYRYVTEGTFDSYMWQILENKQRFISQILTSKTPARITEDADELVLTCAEVKAIATGSPLVREKLELDVEVERLKIARKGFMAEQAARKKFIEITGPQKIEACKKDKACAEADADTIKSFVKPEDGTLIVFGGKRFADEKEIGEAIVKAVKAGVGTELVGSYKGMKFSLSRCFNWQMNLTGKMTYSEDVHLGNFAENFKRIIKMEEEIAAYSKKMDDEISDIQKNIEEAKTFYEQPFPREDEYQKKLLRLQELTVLLSDSANNDKKQIAIEEERRVEYLCSYMEKSINGSEEMDDVSEISELISAYASHVAIRLKMDDSPWSELKDQALAENFLRDGYDDKKISEVLLKYSPKVYDAPTVERIVSLANASAKDSNVVSACR